MLLVVFFLIDYQNSKVIYICHAHIVVKHFGRYTCSFNFYVFFGSLYFEDAPFQSITRFLIVYFLWSMKLLEDKHCFRKSAVVRANVIFQSTFFRFFPWTQHVIWLGWCFNSRVDPFCCISSPSYWKLESLFNWGLHFSCIV